MSDAPTDGLCIRTLGAFEVAIDGQPIAGESWPRKKTKAVLKLLLTSPGANFTIDQIIEALFPEADPERAARNVQARVSELRRVLEPELEKGADSRFILHVGEGYALTLRSDVWIDTQAFANQLQVARALADAGEWVSSIEALEDTLALYRGDFLAEDRYAEWAEAARQRHREQHLEGLIRLAESYAELGRLRQAISCCQRVLTVEPHREDAVQRLMEFQDQAGQRAEAIETYREFRSAISGYLDAKPSGETEALRLAIEDRRSATGDSCDPRRIAVLPLENYGLGPDDLYFADSMTEELIGTLSQVQDLRVLARTSVARYKDTSKPISQIRRELGAGSLIEGSVRNLGDGVRVSIQLIDGVSESHLWAGDFDCAHGDFLKTQHDIAEQVVSSLRIELLPAEKKRVSAPPTGSIEAHLLYMRGLRELVNDSDASFEKAIQHFEEAVAIDPSFARAYAGTAHAVLLLSRSTMALDQARPRLQEALDSALALDPKLPEAHAMQGLFLWAFQRDAIEAEAAIRRAIHLNPSYVEAHACMRDLMGQRGRRSESLLAAREALTLGAGLDPDLYCGVGRALTGLGRFEEAIAYFREARAIDPDYRSVLRGLADAKERLWHWDAAEEHRRRLLDLHPTSPWSNLGYIFHLNSRARMEESLDLVRSFPRDRASSVLLSYLEGGSLMLMRQHAKAIEILRQSAEEHEHGLAHSGWIGINQLRAMAHAEVGEHEEALRHFEAAFNEAQSFGNANSLPIWETGIAWVRGRAGDNQAVPRLIGRLLGRANDPVIPTLLAILHFSRGSVDEGFKWLNTAVDRHERDPLSMIKVHPWFDPARDDPRFEAVLKRMNLAD